MANKLTVPEILSELKSSNDDANAFYQNSAVWQSLESQIPYDDWCEQHEFDKALVKQDQDHIAAELQSTENQVDFLQYLQDQHRKLIPVAGSDKEKDELIRTLKDMLEQTPGMADALEELGFDTNIKAAQGGLYMVSQGQLYLQREINAMSQSIREIYDAQEKASADSSLAKTQAELQKKDMSNMGEYFLMAAGRSPAELGKGVVHTVEKILHNIESTFFAEANVTALEDWLAWDPNNTIAPTTLACPRPKDHQEMLLMSLEPEYHMMSYAGLHSIVKRLVHSKANSRELLTFAFTLQAALEQVYAQVAKKSDTIELEMLIFCYRGIEILMRMSTLTDVSQKSRVENLLAKYNLVRNAVMSVGGEVLVLGIARFLQSCVDGSGRLSPVQAIYNQGCEKLRCLPQASDDTVVLVIDQQSLLALYKPFDNGMVKVCSINEVEIEANDDFELEVVFPAFGIRKNVSDATQQWYYQGFKQAWDNFFTQT